MAEKSTEEGYEEATDEYFGNLINLQEVSKIAQSIHVKEAQGLYHEAVEDLLEAIGKAKEPGKWRMLIDALRNLEDSAILDVLLEEQKVKEREWLTTQCKNLIEVFKEDIVEYLHLEHLLSVMVEKGLILKGDMARLNAWIDSGNRRLANISFLLIMHRHKSDWYDIFISVLSSDEHHCELLKKIIGEDKYQMMITKKDTEMLQLSTMPAEHAEQTRETPVPEEHKSTHGDTQVHKAQQDLMPGSALAFRVPRKQLSVRDRSPGDVSGDRQGTVPVSSNCSCGCCKQVLSVLEVMCHDLLFMTEKMSSLETEVSQLRLEFKK